MLLFSTRCIELLSYGRDGPQVPLLPCGAVRNIIKWDRLPSPTQKSPQKMDYPNEDLPERQLSLLETVKLHRRAVEVWNEKGNNAGVDDRAQCINTILCGRWHDPDLRMSLNARQGALIPDLDDCTVTRDYDSIIGLTDHIPYDAPLSIYPVPSFKFTITRPAHIYATVYTSPVCYEAMSPLLNLTSCAVHSGCVGSRTYPSCAHGMHCYNFTKASAPTCSPSLVRWQGTIPWRGSNSTGTAVQSMCPTHH